MDIELTIKQMLINLRRSLWTLLNTNPQVINTEYAVRGVVPTQANALAQKLKSEKFPFSEVTYCNIGNPQEFGQKPISFYREVMAALLDPKLLDKQVYSKDVNRRVKAYLDEIVSAGSYTASLGIPSVRRNVAEFISKTYKVPKPQIQNIFLTEGASQGVHLVLNAMITDKRDSILVPVPQYPLYSGVIELVGGHLQEYYQNQEEGWSVKREHLETQLKKDRAKGKTVRAIVLINPGNPTGSILSRESLVDILQFAHEYKLVVIADEVYRENVYSKQFLSAREVLSSLGGPINEQLELITLNSVSKGVMGECGLRGGYMELYNIQPEVRAQLEKLKTLFLCSNSVGQIGVDLLVKPPVEDVLEETKVQFLAEKKALFDSLKRRSELVYNSLKQMERITIAPVDGAMYAFPRVHFSDKVLNEARHKGMKPDLMYCLQLLHNTGIVTVPGSGFKQEENTFHFRITTLILPEENLKHKLAALSKFNSQFHKRFA